MPEVDPSVKHAPGCPKAPDGACDGPPAAAGAEAGTSASVPRRWVGSARVDVGVGAQVMMVDWEAGFPRQRLAFSGLRGISDEAHRSRCSGVGLRALFSISFDALEDPSTPSRMSMLSAMLSPEVLGDSDLRRVVEDGQARFRSLLAELIARDRERGDLPARIDAEATASVIATYSEGLNRVAVVAYDRSRLERQTELLLDSLGL